MQCYTCKWRNHKQIMRHTSNTENTTKYRDAARSTGNNGNSFQRTRHFFSVPWKRLPLTPVPFAAFLYVHLSSLQHSVHLLSNWRRSFLCCFFLNKECSSFFHINQCLLQSDFRSIPEFLNQCRWWPSQLEISPVVDISVSEPMMS